MHNLCDIYILKLCMVHMIKITHLSLSWADGDRGSVLWSPGQ